MNINNGNSDISKILSNITQEIHTKDQKLDYELSLQSKKIPKWKNRINFFIYIIISSCFCYKIIEFTLFSKENIIKFLLKILIIPFIEMSNKIESGSTFLTIITTLVFIFALIMPKSRHKIISLWKNLFNK